MTTGRKYLIGVDEAGRGCLFGSVDVCAVCILDPGADAWLLGPGALRDSKAFTDASERHLIGCALVGLLHQADDGHKYRSPAAGLWSHRGATSAEVDAEGNILRTVIRLWHAAIAAVVRCIAEELGDASAAAEGRVHVVVDGTQFLPFDTEKEPLLRGVTHECMVRADARVREVSAASILAKNFHDDDVAAIARHDPTVDARYEVLRNKGYGTKRHIEGIRAHGYSRWHRRSFRIKSLEEDAAGAGSATEI